VCILQGSGAHCTEGMAAKASRRGRTFPPAPQGRIDGYPNRMLEYP
jgi:hypothetical protein